MKIPPKRLAPASLLLLLAVPLGADVSILRGAPAGARDVHVYPVAGGGAVLRPPALQSIVLLPIDFVERAAFDALTPERARLVTDVGVQGRIVLPQGGSLYRYRRDGPAGAAFGYFVVGVDGIARSLFERPGTGPAASADPIPHPISIAPDGSAFLFATTRDAGGDLIELDLASGDAIVRTIALQPRRFVPGSLRLLDAWGFGICRDGAFRFDRTSGVQATAVPFPDAQAASFAWVAEGAAVSADGSTAAIVCGPFPTETYVFAFERTGIADQVSLVGRPFSRAGFLATSALAPTLALAPDGSQVAWRSEGKSAEAWVRARRVPAPPPSFQITADERFTDTLGETGVIRFVNPSTLIFTVGEAAAATAAGIENADVFRLDVSTGELVNLSGTSGETSAPFLLPGTLNTEDGLWARPDELLLVPESAAGPLELLSLDWQSGARRTLLTNVRSVEAFAVAGPEVFLALQRDTPARPLELHRLPATPGALPVRLGSLPRDCDRVLLRGSPGGALGALVQCGLDRWLGRGRAGSNAGALLFGQPFAYGPTIDVQPDGSVFGTVVLGSTYLFRWRPSGSVAPLAGFADAALVLPSS